MPYEISKFAQYGYIFLISDSLRKAKIYFSKRNIRMLPHLLNNSTIVEPEPCRTTNYTLSIQNATRAVQNISWRNQIVFSLRAYNDENGKGPNLPILDSFEQTKNGNAVLKMANFSPSEFRILYVNNLWAARGTLVGAVRQLWRKICILHVACSTQTRW